MNYTVMSEEAVRYLCGVINQVVSLPTDVINNINLADNLTFSNIHIKNLIDQCLIDANTEAQKLVGALTHLTCEETSVQPTLDNSQVNVIYLYSTTGTAPYQQYLKISDTKLIDLGSTSISLADYITATEIASTYAKQVDLNTLTDEVNAVKDTIGTETLTTTSQTITGAINEVKTSVPTDDDIKSLADEQITGNSVDYVSNYVDTSLIPNMSLIKSTYFGSYVPSSTNRTDDPNETTLATIRTKHANCPTDTMEYIIFTIITDKKFGSEVSFNDIAEKKQIAIASNKNSDIYVRSHAYDSATWTKWQRVCTTSVADVPRTNIPCSEPDKFPGINSGGCTYYVYNSICYVSLWGISSITVENDIVIPGAILPKPANGSIGSFLTAQGSALPTIFAYIQDTGQLTINVNTANILCYGSFSYPVAES